LFGEIYDPAAALSDHPLQLVAAYHVPWILLGPHSRAINSGAFKKVPCGVVGLKERLDASPHGGVITAGTVQGGCAICHRQVDGFRKGFVVEVHPRMNPRASRAKSPKGRLSKEWQGGSLTAEWGGSARLHWDRPTKRLFAWQRAIAWIFPTILSRPASI
jgi:hypothetical protein